MECECNAFSRELSDVRLVFVGRMDPLDHKEVLMRRIVSALVFLGLAASFAPLPLSAYSQEKATARQVPTLKLQKGHSDIAYTTAVSNDGKWLVTAGHDGRPTLWETATGREVRTFVGHHDFINDMIFSDDGKWLATCSGQGNLLIDEANDTVRFLDASTRLWKVATGEQIQGFQHEGKVTSLSMSSDGKLLATGGNDRSACVWNVSTGKRLHTFRHPAIKDGGDISVALSPDGKRLFTADDRIRSWDLTTGEQVRVFQPHNGEIKTLKVPVNVAEKTADGLFEHRKVVYEVERRTWIDRLALRADGKRLVTIGTDDRVVVWDAVSGKSIRDFQVKDIRSRSAVTSDGKWLFAYCPSAKGVQMWDLAAGKAVRTFAVNHSLNHGVAVSKDGRWLFATDDSADGANVAARMWDVNAGRLVRVFAGMLESVNSVSLSDDGKRLVTASGNQHAQGARTAQLWDLVAGKQVRIFKGHTGAVYSAVISSEGKRIASGGADDFARSWDADTGKELHTFLGNSGAVMSVALSKDGKWLAAGSGGMGLWTSDRESGFGTRCFNLDSGARTHLFVQIDGVRAVTISNDGNWLAAAGWNKKLQLWDIKTGKVAHDFKGHDNVVATVALSRDGKWLVSGGFDGTAKLWDAQKGKHIRTFKGHASAIYCLALSHNGKWLATGSDDRTVRLTDLATGETIRVFKGHTEAVTGVALSADGKRIITTSIDGTTRIWNVNTGKQLCRLLTLTDGNRVVLDDKGRFDSGADRDIAGIHWVNGMETSPLGDRVPGLLSKLLTD
jgi:WD40 repeat protein